MPAQPPSILQLVCHDLGRHVGPYGVPTVDTPALDRLAAEGARFANSFCTSPGCSPSRAALAGAIRKADSAVREILAALEASGRADNTLVLFTADHGLAFPRAKGTLHDAGIETALLVRWPGIIPPGVVLDELVSNVDVVP